MDASDLIKALQNTLQGGGRPHMEKSDPELLFAPALIEQAMIHNMAGALTGTLQNDFWQSDTMRRFASSAGSRAGIAFNRMRKKSLYWSRCWGIIRAA